MKATLALSIAALGFTVLSQAAHADTDTYADKAINQAYSAPSTLTRAEVQADLALWQRAGLEAAAGRESFDPTRPDIASRLAQYKQWRSGSEYRNELARLQDKSMTAQAPSSRMAN
ncbi:DUF4148 domain-containing protein [Rhizobacter sp. OV335]|jgi:hypothetical protein|uniref:DUF4148 domain-containing protein n=1 Tax=Rhizobacter sp. OV335 TaxID=1500264 RepID=UPI000919E27D|nr:DUF4148 domain-containing protein [Rhizobacter sp. OV335]SHL98379.1 protein of unknown function [Rhizobacter sp. OV335]